jgi:phospholipid/cholesterol/gamma-HCH transport system permease protein
MYSNFKLNEISTDTFELVLLNKWNRSTLKKNIQDLEKVNLSNNSRIQINFQDLKECDSSAIIYLISFTKRFTVSNVELKNLDSYEIKYKFYEKHYQDNNLIEKEKSHFIENIGRSANDIFLSFVDFTKFLGKIFYFFIYSLFNPRKMRIKAMFKYIDSSAVNALFIVGITSFLVGVVIAYQGAVQLEKFGANIFIVEMISITMFREIAPLVTAIVIAGTKC